MLRINPQGHGPPFPAHVNFHVRWGNSMAVCLSDAEHIVRKPEAYSCSAGKRIQIRGLGVWGPWPSQDDADSGRAHPKVWLQSGFGLKVKEKGPLKPSAPRFIETPEFNPEAMKFQKASWECSRAPGLLNCLPGMQELPLWILCR